MVYLISRAGGTARPPVPPLADVRDADWSADGSRLVFAYLTDAASAQLPRALPFISARTAKRDSLFSRAMILPRRKIS